MAIAQRVTADAEPVLTPRDGIPRPHVGAHQRFLEYRGFGAALLSQRGRDRRVLGVPRAVVVIDLSPLRKWEVLGPDAETLMQRAITRDVRKLAVGQVVYTALCNETGGMIDDATVYRLGENNFRFVGGDEYDGIWLRELAAREGLKVWSSPRPTSCTTSRVQGPFSREALPRSSGPRRRRPRSATSSGSGCSSAGSGATTESRSSSHAPATRANSATRSGVTPRMVPAVWDAMWAAAEPFGLMPLGLAALDLVRIESGLIFAGYEFDDQVDPFEAGIGFAVALADDEDFVGRDALIERKAHPQRALVGLEIDSNEVCGHGDEVYVGRQRVGVVTSGMRSPLLKKTIALCRLATTYAELGTDVEVGKLDGLQKRIAAKVVRFPFYDPEKTRPRS